MSRGLMVRCGEVCQSKQQRTVSNKQMKVYIDTDLLLHLCCLVLKPHFFSINESDYEICTFTLCKQRCLSFIVL